MAQTKKSSRKKTKNKRRCWKPPKHNTEAIRTKNLSGQEKRIHKNTKERRPMLDVKTNAKKGKGNMRNASKYNRKLNP